MNEKFVEKIYKTIVEDGVGEYKNLLDNTAQKNATDKYWINALELYEKLTSEEKEKMLKEREISKQKSIIASSNKIKILLAGHPYNLHDEFIGKQIENVLEKNNIEIIYSDKYDTKYLEQEVKKISPKNYWTYNKEIIGAISHYQELVDGIILITSFPCGPDSLSNEMILRNVKIPITNLIIDEANSDTGLLTRIERFIDRLEEKKKNHDERENN